MRCCTARPNMLRGKIFVYQGDVDGQDIDLLELDQTILHVTNEVTLAESLDYPLELFAADATLQRVPTFANRAVHT